MVKSSTPRSSMLRLNNLQPDSQVQGFSFRECLLTSPTSLLSNFKTSPTPKSKGISRYPSDRWLLRDL
jgi:hypothetical protein